jgi:hypothetical protein
MPSTLIPHEKPLDLYGGNGVIRCTEVPRGTLAAPRATPGSGTPRVPRVASGYPGFPYYLGHRGHGLV